MRTRYARSIEGVIALFSYVAFASACSVEHKPAAPSPEAASDREKIESLIASAVEAANKGDLETLMYHFADDAVLILPEEVPVFGKRLFRPRFEKLFMRASVKVFFTVEETMASGDLAFTRGYTSGAIDPRGAEASTYIGNRECIIVFTKDGSGQWEIARLITSPMYPPQGPRTRSY